MKYLTAILILSAPSLKGQTAEEIINRYLDTVSNGNIENWYRIKTMYTENESYYSQNAFDQKVDFVTRDKPTFNKTYFAYPNNHRKVERYNMKIESYKDSTFSMPSGTSYFLTDKMVLLIGNLPPVVKPPFEPDEFFSPHTPVYVWKLMNKSKSVELLAVKEFAMEENECYEIQIEVKEKRYFLYINKKTLLLEIFNASGTYTDPSSLGRFSNYRDVEGFLIPMTTRSAKNGITFFSDHIKKIKLNVDIDPSVFEYKEK